jgi:succinate dehydrogenase / fumarate reductase, cytochrome b subunit
MAGRNDFRSTSFGSALRYKGREGMWTWMLHRVTGLGILLFLILHVADTALVVYRPDWYDHALSLYKHPVFRVGEVAIYFSVLYHALNGMRIVIQDFWPVAMRHQKKLAWTAAGLTLVGFLPAAWIMLAPIFGLAEEPGAERHRQRMEHSQPAGHNAAPVTVTLEATP